MQELSISNVVAQNIGMNKIIPCFVFLCAYHNSRHQLDPFAYYGTETNPNDDIILGNAIAQIAQEHFGVVFDDPSDEDLGGWSDYAQKATSAELSSKLKDAALKALIDASIIKNEGPLFVVVIEHPFMMDFFSQPLTYAEHVEFWDMSFMTEEAGWSAAEAEQISTLTPGQSLMVFGDFAHSIIRLR